MTGTRKFRIAGGAAAAMLAGLLGGCVERMMTLESNPPGALVYVNDQEIGRTPLTREFTWYGNYDVQLRKEGYETANTHTWVVAPWWQWPPFDFFAELVPLRLRDDQHFTYSLRPASTQPVDANAIMARGRNLKTRLESSEHEAEQK
jgi:hypothetical protein